MGIGCEMNKSYSVGLTAALAASLALVCMIISDRAIMMLIPSKAPSTHTATIRPRVSISSCFAVAPSISLVHITPAISLYEQYRMS